MIKYKDFETPSGATMFASNPRIAVINIETVTRIRALSMFYRVWYRDA